MNEQYDTKKWKTGNFKIFLSLSKSQRSLRSARSQKRPTMTIYTLSDSVALFTLFVALFTLFGHVALKYFTILGPFREL